MKRRRFLAAAGAAGLLATRGPAAPERTPPMSKKPIKTDLAPQAIGPYSQAIVAGGLVFCSGQIPLDPKSMTIVEGGIEEQTKQVLRNLGAVLEAAGCGFADVVKCTVFLQDMDDFQKMNAAYGDFFPAPFPARAAVEVARLPRDVKVEIECVAVKS